MRSAPPGPSTSPVEVTNVSPHGFWLFVGEREMFVSFKDFPWFREATVRELTNVQLPSPHHLYWPDLDIDLAVESIGHPEKYPLVSQAPLRKRVRAVKARRSSARKRARPARVRG
jgi:Protein of unknown function (DUF2442)